MGRFGPIILLIRAKLPQNLDKAINEVRLREDNWNIDETGLTVYYTKKFSLKKGTKHMTSEEQRGTVIIG